MSNQENELDLELLGINGFNFAAKHNSSSRNQMFSSHFSQKLVIEGCNKKRIKTGIEYEFSKHTFSIKIPENARIIKTIQRYPQGIGKGSINFNPETIVIFEIDETKEIDYVSIPYFNSFHTTFGFKYDQKSVINKLTPGSYIAKNTILADSPSVDDEDGDYKYGINLNTAFMSLPSTSEDGIMISEDVLDKLKFRIYETRSVEFGSNNFPLNLFGTKDEYKPFAEIGDYIKEDGLLMMLRNYNDELSPVTMSIFDTMEPDYIFDKATYTRAGKGRIVDIKIVSNNSKVKKLPPEMCPNIDKYEKALLKFHNELILTEQQLRAERKRKFGVDNLVLTPRLHRLIVKSLSITNHNFNKTKVNLNLLYRKNPIDEYRVDFTIEYVIKPNIGFKLTTVNGSKGVICKIEKPENMPIDEAGNRADIVIDPSSNISRMNLGNLYEHYISAAIRDVAKDIRRRLNLETTTLKQIKTIDSVLLDNAYSYLLSFYKVISSKQYNFFNEVSNEDKLQHLTDVINEGIYVYFPISNEKQSIQIVKDIELLVRPTHGPVSYVGNSGRRCITDNPVRIAEMYFMLLEKIADDWSSVSVGKLHHFGVLSPTIKSEKYAYPYRCTPIRTIGETEGRILISYLLPLVVIELIDRSNNMPIMKNITHNLLTADKPTDIDDVVDRNFYQLGGSKPLQLINHIFYASGFCSTYIPENQLPVGVNSELYS
jgi:DNA-directed RNA polymerase beta subunit